MEFFVVCLLLVGIFAMPNDDDVKAKIIKDKGFCVQTKSSGVEFKKCYDLVERKD